MGHSTLLRDRARELLNKADYLLNKTYFLVKEEKIFLSVTRHLIVCVNTIVDLVLYIAKVKGQISEVPKIRYQKLRNLHDLKKKFGLSRDQLFFFDELIQTYSKILEIEDAMNEEMIQFKRQGKYVICKKDYKVEVISYSSLNQMLRKCQHFLAFIEKNF